MNITGKYNFEIKKNKNGYIAIGKIPNKKGSIIVRGETKEEIFNIISDAYLTALDIKVSWWNKLLYKLKK